MELVINGDTSLTVSSFSFLKVPDIFHTDLKSSSLIKIAGAMGEMEYISKKNP